ncbi:MFS transporter [Paenibacillus guangzhouensis]|uniref:hypothetical protein n=1 Tax=Paenibacillus guangzhouensis TaxID=1473112 RepID=UPI002AB27B6E|nr:hypothetical protein [Paenibacillus guangzhouensis]
MLMLGIFGAIGSRLGGYGVDRWGASRVITASVALHVVALALLPLFSGMKFMGLFLIVIIVFAMFLAGPAIQTYFIQQAPHSSNLVLSLNTSIIHFGLAAGAGAGGALVSSTSTVLYNPWLASIVVSLGLAAAIVSFYVRGKREVQTTS